MKTEIKHNIIALDNPSHSNYKGVEEINTVPVASKSRGARQNDAVFYDVRGSLDPIEVLD